MSEERSYPVTKEGLQQWREELDDLITVKRPDLARQLRNAIAEGDLKENANYHDTKEKQGFLEGRVMLLQEMVNGAQIIEEGVGEDGQVVLGSKVVVVDEEDYEATYMLVGPAEANPREGRISNESPLGNALLGAKSGDTITFSAPAGDILYKIVSVS